MTGATKQCWMEFAAFAAKEQDPKKLIELARKINERLDKRFWPLPEQKRSDPDVLADLRDALNRVRNAAWAVQQYVVRKESNQDSNNVLSFLAGERIRVAYQLCQALSDDLNGPDLEFQRGSLVQLHEVTKALTKQLQRNQPCPSENSIHRAPRQKRKAALPDGCSAAPYPRPLTILRVPLRSHSGAVTRIAQASQTIATGARFPPFSHPLT